MVAHSKHSFRTLWSTAVAHQIPLVVAGAGAAWLAFRARASAARRHHLPGFAYGGPHQGPPAGIESVVGDLGETVKKVAASAAETAKRALKSAPSAKAPGRVGTAATEVVCVERQYRASSETVYDAFLDPARAGKFLFATPQGEMTQVDIDARVGGSFLLVERRDGNDVRHVGIYHALERPHRIAFTFAVPGVTPQTTSVVLDITPVGPESRVVLTHEGVPAAHAERDRHGWSTSLDALAKVLGEA